MRLVIAVVLNSFYSHSLCILLALALALDVILCKWYPSSSNEVPFGMFSGASLFTSLEIQGDDLGIAYKVLVSL